MFFSKEDFVWGFEAEAFSGPMIQTVLCMRNFLFGILSQTSLFRKVLT